MTPFVNCDTFLSMSFTHYSDDFETEETTVVVGRWKTPELETSPVEAPDHWPDNDDEIRRICAEE